MPNCKYEVSAIPCRSYNKDEVKNALTALIDSLGGLDWLEDGMCIAIKANLVTFAKPETATTTATEALAIWTSSWYYADAAGGTASGIPTRTVSIELPVYAGNEYQTEYNDLTKEDDDKIESVEYTLLVEAVQANGTVEYSETAYIDDATGLK